MNRFTMWLGYKRSKLGAEVSGRDQHLVREPETMLRTFILRINKKVY